MSQLESAEVFQCLRATGLLTFELRVLREVSRRCCRLYRVHVITWIDADPLWLSDKSLKRYAFLQTIGAEPHREGVHEAIIRAVGAPHHDRGWYSNLKKLVPLEEVRERFPQMSWINIDNLVEIYGQESITLEALEYEVWFCGRKNVISFMPRILQVAGNHRGILKRVLQSALVLFQSPSKFLSWGPLLQDWLREIDPTGDLLSQEIYWEAIEKHLERNRGRDFGTITNVNGINAKKLFGDIPITWRLPRRLWQRYGWLVIALTGGYGSPIIANLQEDGLYHEEFLGGAQGVPITPQLRALIPSNLAGHFAIIEPTPREWEGIEFWDDTI